MAFLKVRSMTIACPTWSSCVGTNGSLQRVNPLPSTHSRVSHALGEGWSIPSSQSRCLVFQSPVMIVGMFGLRITKVSQSIIYVMPFGSSNCFWL